MLAVLALTRGPVSADTLAAAIWGEETPVTWQVALRGTVRGLRAALAPLGGPGTEVIRTVPPGYMLGPTVAVDVHEAAAAVARAAELLAVGRSQAALDLAAPAAEVTGAALLPDEDAPWLAAHRAAVDATAAAALSVVSVAASALGDHPRAIAAARRAVADAALDERAHRSLIRALHLAGDRAGAVHAYERCRAALAEELGVDPSTETVAAYLEATAGQTPSGTARAPTATTSFIGRDADVASLAAALDGPGLVTLTGRGGVGKSRVAAEVLARVDVPGRRFWLPLSAVAEGSLVAVTVALGLGIDAVVDDPAAALVAYLSPLGRTVLVLDGADVVTDAAANLAVSLVEACPMLTVLVTSRAPLSVDRERVVALGPLAGPTADDPHSVATSAQGRLLADRVHAAGGSLATDPATSAAVAELCRRCDGLPLALEVAAAQLTDLSVGDLLDQLGETRHDQLRAVTASSYALLDTEEALVFRRFAVLDGPTGLAFARAVLGGSGVVPERLVRILRELGTRGLIVVDRSGPRWMYSQDDDVHRFAAELLAAAGEQHEAYERLLDALRALLPEDARQPPAPYAAAVSTVIGSVRSVFAAGLAARADRSRCLELAFRLHRYWAATSVTEGRFWLSRLLAVAGDSPWRKYATYAVGYLGYWAGDTAAALRDLRAAIVLFGEEPDPFVARAYIYTAGLLDDLDRPREALEHVRRSIAIAESFGTDLYVAAAMGIASVLSERGDSAAVWHAAQAVARCRVDGSAEQLAALLPTAAMVCWQVGALDEARAYIAMARPMHVDHKRIARVVLLSTATGLALADGDLDAAIDHGRAADDEGRELGVEREMPLIRAVLARALLRRGDVAAAAHTALAGVDVAAGMSVAFPLAIGLETAALIGAAVGADVADIGALIGTAAAIRVAGDRPAPAPIAGDLDALSAGSPVTADDAVAIARRVLGIVLTAPTDDH